MNRSCWRNFLGLNPKGPYLSVEDEKDNFCVVFTYSIKRVCEIRKFHVAGGGGGNNSKEMYKIARCTCKFVVLSIKTYYFFAVLLPLPLSLVLLSSRNSATMVM